MSEMTATRTARALTLAAAAVGWSVAAWLLTRTSVPTLHLGDFDEHRWFSARSLRRAHRYTVGSELLWLGSTVTTLAALGVLAWRLPPSIRRMGLGRIGSSIIAGMVVLVTLWFSALPFGLASLWWDHHWGLGPFHVGAWLGSQWGQLAGETIGVMLSIVLLVAFAARFRRRWWLLTAPTIVAIAAAFAFLDGWLAAAGTHRVADASLRGDVARIERVEGVRGTPVRIQDVSSWTRQANAFTTGFGPSTHVVLWDTLLDGRFSRRQVDVVVAHELGHVRSRHILKAIGWSALVVLPTLWLVALATRRRGGLADPANVPLAILVLATLALATGPLENVVSRRYEAEADWRALNATRDPQAAAGLFRSFERTSLEQPNPPLLDYLWLENHPTLMQRIAMTRRWGQRDRLKVRTGGRSRAATEFP